MLVLSRGLNESIVIGEGENAVVVTVTQIREKYCHLGVDAKPSIPVHRQETQDKLNRKKNDEKSP